VKRSFYHDMDRSQDVRFLLPSFHSIMYETMRLLDSAAALSPLLQESGIRHAFYGSVVSAVFANSMHSDVSKFHWRSHLIL
jgi:hypothetical protein